MESKYKYFRHGKVGRDSTFQHGNIPLIRHVKTYLRMRFGGIFRFLRSIPPSVKRPLPQLLQCETLSLLFAEGPGWIVCQRSSASVPVLTLCSISHYQRRGSCLSLPAHNWMEVSNHFGQAHFSSPPLPPSS